MIYMKILKWVGLVALALSLVYGIYYTGYRHASSSVTAKYETRLNKLLQAANKARSEAQRKALILESKYIDEMAETKALNTLNSNKLRQLLRRSDDGCVNQEIPNNVLDSLR